MTQVSSRGTLEPSDTGYGRPGDAPLGSSGPAGTCLVGGAGGPEEMVVLGSSWTEDSSPLAASHGAQGNAWKQRPTAPKGT